MMLVIGFASALSAFASLPRWRTSTFLTILSDLFAFETILFGLADIVALLGYWPAGLRGLFASALPAARDRAVRRRHLRHFALSLRAQDGGAHRPVLRGADADLHPPVAAAADGRAPEPLCAHQHLLPDPDQPVPGRARRPAQFLLPGVRQRHPGSGRCPSGRVLAAVASGLRSAGHDLDPGVPRRVLRRAEFRPAMAALDDRVLHVALAPAFDALQARARPAPRPTTRTSASPRTSAASSAAPAASAPT